jgi:YHS domain-containing protein
MAWPVLAPRGEHLHGRNAPPPEAHLATDPRLIPLLKRRCSMTRRTSHSRVVGAGFRWGFGWAWLVCGTVLAHPPRSIDWQDDLPRAQVEAQARNRLLLIQFTGPWCHNCRRMDRESLAHPRVAGIVHDQFVAVKLSCEVHEQLALGFGFTGLPATVILSPSGDVIARNQGFLDAAAFHLFLQDALIHDGRLRGPAAPAAPREDDAPAPARAEPEVALAGYCPVSLVQDRRLVPGQRSWTIEHNGRTYQFSSAQTRALFQSQPERFIPVNGGCCPVAQVDRGESVAGDPRCGVLYQGHLYLCADETCRKHFLNHPERYARVDVADRGFCPHCWGREHLLVRGRPPHSLTLGGQRYLFPDPTHLEAFRAAAPSPSVRR